MAKKPKVSKTQAVRENPKVSDALPPSPLEKQRLAVRGVLRGRPDGTEF